MLSAPPKIDLLPEHLIDQIKAGEVIERPGNLLKEILENAVDAGATRLELTLKNNGLDLISLKDNGHGMHFDDLPLAFSRHATSKISRFEDLYRLRSFGFRGEALASISSISRLQCISSVVGSGESAEIRIEGGQTTFHGKRKSNTHGTELVIQDLFYNTPARLKFIQSQNSEKQFIKKIIFAFILTKPGIEFVVQYDDEEKEIYSGAPDLRHRILDILPKTKDQVSYIQKFYENNELELYLIPGNFKAPVKWQYIFINDRFVIDKQFHRVICNALQLSFGTDEFHYMAFLNMPGDCIDVNVHPSKTVIKCLESSKLIGLLTSSIKELGSARRETYTPPRTIEPQGFDLTSMPTLSQERHDYNMEGLFSPHGLNAERSKGLNWIDGGYFLKENAGKTFAYSARRLLSRYIYSRLEMSFPVIPLLVSEPYPSKGVNKEIKDRLILAGIELEDMGPDTLVLRGIPDWMNGFPLRPVIDILLKGHDFSEFEIQIAEWSSSTWEEMISSFPIDELLKEKVVIDLGHLLKERLR
ncbi:MAG TPA: DNA mismatch repair endonuclease MutL [Bacteriovoracaceae bacterium]|nr:DNA mismatch repair endonuclease MutL [Bacteriovoracaceae bacterium]